MMTTDCSLKRHACSEARIIVLVSLSICVASSRKYAQGAITAADLVRSLERDVMVLIPGCDLDDAVAAALEATPDTRKRDLLSKAR